MVLNSIPNLFLTPIYSNKKITIVMFIIVIAIVTDTSFIKTYDLIGKKESLGWRTIAFASIVSISIVGQYLVLGFVKQKSINNIITPKEIHLNTIHKIVTLVQYALLALLVFVLLQILVTSYYSTIMLTAITSISYILAIAMLALFARRFFSWYKTNRNSVVLLYGLSSAILAINAGFTFFLVNNAFLALPKETLPKMLGSAYNPLSSWAIILTNTYFVSSILSFLITWAATTSLLRHFSRRLGRVNYWIILAIPLAYFLSQFITFFLNTFQPLLQSDPIFFNISVTLLFTLSKPIGGILFGVAFWIVARGIIHNNVVRNYMIISAYGFVLLFASNQAIVLVTAPYPPFGLATVSFMGISSYLVLVGIYSSAISVSLDVGLRKSIRKSVNEHLKFLDSIGSAQMDQGIQELVLKMTKEHADHMAQETGIKPSVTEDDMKQYLNNVLKEISTTKNRPLGP
ncbi:MAG TPA: hypothetical protein VFS97_00240 [Nitrososphaeraceae archaeon]|nr:hypothetical protein [Nitrososphaeraceae archaeon]